MLFPNSGLLTNGNWQSQVSEGLNELQVRHGSMKGVQSPQ